MSIGTKYYNVTEAAAKLRVSKSTISKHAHRHQIGSFTANGDRPIFSPEDLTALRKIIKDAKPGNPQGWEHINDPTPKRRKNKA